MPPSFPSPCGREQETADAIMHWQLGGGGVDGPDRAVALKRTFEYIEDKLCDVTLVFGVTKSATSSLTTTSCYSSRAVATYASVAHFRY